MGRREGVLSPLTLRILVKNFIWLNTVETLLTQTLVSGQLYLRPPSQNPVLVNSIQTVYFYILVSEQFS